ncbi:MAG: MATE family efflux transporter [Planctomycetota bacterium]
MRPTGPRLVEGAVTPMLLRMAAAMLVGFLAGAAFNLTDTWFIGRLGREPLAAMGYTLPVVMIVFGVVMAMGIGTTSLVARTLGRGDAEGARRVTLHALVLALLLVGCTTIIGLLALRPILAALGAEGVVQDLAADYLQVWFAGTVFFVMLVVGNAAIRGTGDMLLPSMIMVADLGLNIALDPLFIFGPGPFPAWGMPGAAFATVLSRAVALVASFYVLSRRRHMLAFGRRAWRGMLTTWRGIAHVALPVGLMHLLIPAFVALMTALISAHGNAVVAAWAAGARLEQVAAAPLMALGTALVPFAGQNWGAGRADRVSAALKVAMRVCIIWGLCCALVAAVAHAAIAAAFVEDAEVRLWLEIHLLIVPVAFGLRGLIHAAAGTLNAIGEPWHASALGVLGLVAIVLPLVLIGDALAGFPGLLGGLVVGTALHGALAILWARRRIANSPGGGAARSPASGSAEHQPGRDTGGHTMGPPDDGPMV